MRTQTVKKIPDDVISMMFELPVFFKSKPYQERQDAKLKIVTEFLSSTMNYSRKQIGTLGKSFDKGDLNLIINVFNQSVRSNDRRFLYNTVDFIMSAIYNKNGQRAAHIRSEVKSDYETKNKHFPYIAYGRVDFIKILQKVSKFSKAKGYRTKKFIDVGCGIGDKVLFANLLGYDSYGIEYNEHTYNLGKHFLNEIDYCTLINGDAFSHDFSRYDVIYLYRPISDYRIMGKLYKHIYSTMKAGAKIYDVGTGTGQMHKDIFNKSAPRRNTRGWSSYIMQKRRDGKPWIRELKRESK